MSIFCTGWWYRLSVPAFSLQIGGKERDMKYLEAALDDASVAG